MTIKHSESIQRHKIANLTRVGSLWPVLFTRADTTIYSRCQESYVIFCLQSKTGSSFAQPPITSVKYLRTKLSLRRLASPKHSHDEVVSPFGPRCLQISPSQVTQVSRFKLAWFAGGDYIFPFGFCMSGCRWICGLNSLYSKTNERRE